MIKTEEIRKLLKEHNIDVGLISRSELKVFIRLINGKFENILDADGLEIDGFIEIIIQISIFCFESRLNIPSEVNHPSYGQMVE